MLQVRHLRREEDVRLRLRAALSPGQQGALQQKGCLEEPGAGREERTGCCLDADAPPEGSAAGGCPLTAFLAQAFSWRVS